MLKGFISYSTHDKFVACEVAKALKQLRIEPFLAHDDLSVSQSWRDRIILELGLCDVFVPLLSSDFKASEWCSMECGYIVGRTNVVVLPLSLDRTWPYGFLAEIQGGFLDISQDLTAGRLLSKLRSGLMDRHYDLVFSTILEALERSPTPRTLGGRLRELERHLSSLNAESAAQLVEVLDRLSRMIRSDQRLLSQLRRIYDVLYPVLDEQSAQRLSFLIDTRNKLPKKAKKP